MKIIKFGDHWVLEERDEMCVRYHAKGQYIESCDRDVNAFYENSALDISKADKFDTFEEAADRWRELNPVRVELIRAGEFFSVRVTEGETVRFADLRGVLFPEITIMAERQSREIYDMLVCAISAERENKLAEMRFNADPEVVEAVK